MSNITKVKGTQDFLPDDMARWSRIIQKIHTIMGKYNYGQISTPAFEYTKLFSRSIGEDTDIVNKEMYSWTDQGGKSLTLKPEQTAAVVRAYIENNLQAISSMNKLYYIEPSFRRERPQKGRYRQFNQFGIETIGSPFPEADAEVISIAYRTCQELGITDFELYINSIGSPECRKKYIFELVQYLQKYSDSLSDISKRRIDTNPLRILDTKDDKEIEILEGAPNILEFIDSDSLEHFKTLLALLDASKIPYAVEKKLVRGLDYYNKTTFEIRSNRLGAQSAICGGGRYDSLINQLGGKETAAVGFAMGLERASMLSNLGSTSTIRFIYIASIGDNAIKRAFKLAENLRSLENSKIHLDVTRRSIKSQFREANKLHSDFVIVIGDNELEKGGCTIKNLLTKDEQFVDDKKIIAFFN